MQLTPPLTGFIVRIAVSPIPWLPGHCLLTALHFGEAGHTAEVRWVRPDGSNTSLGFSDATRRDDSGGAVALADGSVVLYASEEATAGAGGATSEVHAYLLPGKVTPMPAAPVGGTVDSVARGSIEKVKLGLRAAGS